MKRTPKPTIPLGILPSSPEAAVLRRDATRWLNVNLRLTKVLRFRCECGEDWETPEHDPRPGNCPACESASRSTRLY